MRAQAIAFVVWAFVAASAVFWGLKALGGGPQTPVQSVTAPAFAPPQADLQRLFGADTSTRAQVAAAPPDGTARRRALDASRLRLLGVVASPGPSGTATQPAPGAALALIAVDGKPARAFRVGTVVEGDHVVQRIEPRRVSLGPRDGETALTLELPSSAPSSTTPPQGAPMGARPGAGAGATPATGPSSTPAGTASSAPSTSQNASDEPQGAAEAPTDPRPPRRFEPPALRAPDRINR